MEEMWNLKCIQSNLDMDMDMNLCRNINTRNSGADDFMRHYAEQVASGVEWVLFTGAYIIVCVEENANIVFLMQ